MRIADAISRPRETLLIALIVAATILPGLVAGASLMARPSWLVAADIGDVFMHEFEVAAGNPAARVIAIPQEPSGRRSVLIELDRAVQIVVEPGRRYRVVVDARGNVLRHGLVGQLVIEASSGIEGVLGGEVIDATRLAEALRSSTPLAARLAAAELALGPCEVAILEREIGRADLDPQARESLLYGAQRCGRGAAAALAILQQSPVDTDVGLVIAALRVLELDGPTEALDVARRWTADVREPVAAAATRAAHSLAGRPRVGGQG